MGKTRIAIVSTPRVGNTWLNYCLADVLNIPTFGVHRHTDLEGVDLPNDMILQVHAEYGNESFHKFINDNSFAVVTIARHPLDVLISMLRFAQIQPSSLQWLDGAGDTRRLHGVKPSQKQFIDWCVGSGSSRLLNISHDWAKSGQAVTVGYERMLTDPVNEVKSVLSHLKIKSIKEKAIIDALYRFDPNFFKVVANEHSWNATKDNWQKFFTTKDAAKIKKKHNHIFDYFHYETTGAVNTRRSQNAKHWDQDLKGDIVDFYHKGVKEVELIARRALIEKYKLEEEVKRLKVQSSTSA